MKANQKIRECNEDDDALIFELLIGAVFALVIGYAGMNIGVFINGNIGDSLSSTLPSNRKTGSFDNTYYDNGTGNKTEHWMNTTFPSGCYAADCDGTANTYVTFTDNSTLKRIWVNLTVNGDYAGNFTIAASGTKTVLFSTLITGTNVSGNAGYLNWTWQTNRTCGVKIRQVGSYYASGDVRTNIENRTVNILGNTSADLSTNTKMVSTAYLIAIITLPLIAIVTIKNFL